MDILSPSSRPLRTTALPCGAQFRFKKFPLWESGEQIVTQRRRRVIVQQRCSLLLIGNDSLRLDDTTSSPLVPVHAYCKPTATWHGRNTFATDEPMPGVGTANQHWLTQPVLPHVHDTRSSRSTAGCATSTATATAQTCCIYYQHTDHSDCASAKAAIGAAVHVQL